MSDSQRRVVVVANRLPVAYDEENGEWDTSPGGLVSALTPILQSSKGSWVGWSGISDQDFDPFEHSDINQVPVTLSQAEYEEFYVGFCNGTLWPLYHDSVRAPEFHRHWWRPYHEVNERFAEVAAKNLGSNDVAWVQDYQLQLVPQMLRDLTEAHKIGFYLHIPFPPVELFAKLPWRRQVLEGLLGADVLAFQSRSSRTNFAVSARRLVGASGSSRRLEWEGREIVLQVAPIGIDTSVFEEKAASEETTEAASQIRSYLGDPDVVILGVDRLDYTKGIDLRMRALQTLLENRPDLIGKMVFVQIAVPSREDVEEYRRIRGDIEGLVGRINGDFAEVGRPPIHYLYRSVPIDELIAYYRAADVMFVTPLRDGMNLVAKEYVATRYDNTGALILSEFAGAAEQLTQAFLVNPFDLNALAGTLEEAIGTASVKGNAPMKALRRSVNRHDVFWWADRCLSALDL
ncbi:MAG TPA: trehalose-6-phosphate synthase [Acidimicrobiia bacterium]|nr:trehalose-6-phosphate synthase [Acidimicrobiia bacterium]